MAVQKLQIKKTIMDSIQYGLKNIPSLLGMVILYALTVWIPYLNVGTTIGLYKSIIKIGNGQVINPLDIFKSEHRANIGEFFLLQGFISIGTAAAAVFAFFPALVIGIAWGFAIYFLIDKGLNPQKCLKVSYKVTYGEKWTIFWIYVLISIIFSVVAGILMGLATIKYVGVVFAILAVGVYLLMFAVYVAVQGVMYKHFSDKADEMFADKIEAKACGCEKPEPAPAPAPAPEAPVAPEAPAEPEA